MTSQKSFEDVELGQDNPGLDLSEESLGQDQIKDHNGKIETIEAKPSDKVEGEKKELRKRAPLNR